MSVDSPNHEDSTMNRRRFLDMLFTLFKASLAASVLPQWARAVSAQTGEGPPLHYRPLNGRRLRDIALRREHHGNGRFLNPVGLDRSGRLLKVLSWKLFHRNRFAEDLEDQPVAPVSVAPEPFRRRDGVSVTYLKHASLLLRDAGVCMAVDPVFESPFWFMRDYTPLAFDPSRLPVDQVLLTHGHYDHLDTASLARLPDDVHVILPPGYDDILDEAGLKRRTTLDWYETHRDGDREIVFLPANHWSMRNPIAGPNLGLWGSYLVRTASGPTVFISGDTAYFDGFDQIGEEFDIDLAVFNVGAYEPRWFMAQSHIDPRETVQAFRELNAKRLAIMHWGTFRLGDEPVHFPPRHIREEMRRVGLADRLVEWRHGDTIYL
jgi:L-ascorbate metabolism protein UlaG (beta-lactamase superfamily)